MIAQNVYIIVVQPVNNDIDKRTRLHGGCPCRPIAATDATEPSEASAWRENMFFLFLADILENGCKYKQSHRNAQISF